MLNYHIITVTSFQQNCTVIWCDKTRQAAIVDPGGEAERISKLLSQYQLTVSKILLTHAHLDHVGAAVELAKQFKVEIAGPHSADKFWLEALPLQSQQFGLPHCDAFEPDHWLHEGELLTLGEEQLRVFHCPGHTPGHIIFYSEQNKLALVGDVIFKGSVGRTDFPQGSHADLISSIINVCLPLGNDVTFIPGHGPISTFGMERLNNSFILNEIK